MALPVAKLAFIVGAGLLGSVLVKGGSARGFSDILSGAAKIVIRPFRQEDSSISSSKPKNDILMQQTNSLANELQVLASSSRGLTIVTDNRSGAGMYGAVFIVVIVGGGIAWWKGIKLTDMVFATRRGLNDACASVARQLEGVYSSVAENPMLGGSKKTLEDDDDNVVSPTEVETENLLLKYSEPLSEELEDFYFNCWYDYENDFEESEPVPVVRKWEMPYFCQHDDLSGCSSFLPH